MTRVILVLAAVLAACDDDPVPADTPVELPTVTRPAQPDPPKPPSVEPCEQAPQWAALRTRCASDGYVYGVGVSPSIRNRGLAFHGASDRARAALTATRSAEIEDSEIVDSFRCGPDVWALARKPVNGGDSLPECSAAIKDRGAVEEGCPSWMGALAHREGDAVVVGVGVVDGISNPTMARNVARNRAAAEQQKTFRMRVTVNDDGSVGAASTSRVTTVTETADLARCGSLTVARVKSRVLRQ